MSSFQEIANDIQGRRNLTPTDVVRHEHLKNLHKITNRNIVVYYSGWLLEDSYNPHTDINDFDMNGFMTVLYKLDKSKGLDLFLHTPGGSLEATEAIGVYLKKVFHNDIRVIVPHLAMSGGTLIAFAAKEIFMGAHSSLGPIDPHFAGRPAHGVLEEFRQAIEAVKEDPATIEVWKHIISQYKPTFIGECQNAMDCAHDIARSWLADGMFADVADDGEKKTRIDAIVTAFGDHTVSKTHGRHLMIDRCKQLGLNVTAIEENANLQDAILSVHHACTYTLMNPVIKKFIENHNGQTHAMISQPIA